MSSSGECFRTEKLPVSTVLSLSNVMKDYLAGSSTTKDFISSYQRLDEIPQLISTKSKNYELRSISHEVITKQMSHLHLYEQQEENLALYKKDTTFCITTAHQTNLFGGPLYFIQKAVSVIKACQLAKEDNPNFDFVPIFWLGSEDHDFEELNHTFVTGEKIEWDDLQGGAFGRYSTSSLEKELSQLFTLLGETDRALEMQQLFTSAYRNNHSIAAATRVLLHEVLGKYGLLIIDGDDVTLKRQMIPLFRRELTEQFSKQACSPTFSALTDQFGSTQAHARDINLFYLTDRGRHRIVEQPYGFSIHGTKLQFSESKLLQELEDHPEKFSPNVMLRPVMQEFCLPNLMYVGGGGESTYWFQLKGIFEAANVAFPMIALRDTAVYVNRKIAKRIEQIQVSLSDLFQPKQELTKHLVKRETKYDLSLQDAKKQLQDILHSMELKAEEIDYTLKASAKAEEQRILNSIHNLEKKMLRAEKKNHAILVRRVDEIFDSIFPKNSLQERKENFSQYYVNYGEEWIEWMLEQFNLFDQQVKVMIEQ